MKRSALEKHLRERGARFVRHGAGHDKWRTDTGTSIVPRHSQIAPNVVKAICKQLGVDPPRNPN